MTEEIPSLPDAPETLRVAARQGTLVPFIGAGVSRLGGCPDWDEFANRALQFFVSNGLLTHAQFDQLSRLGPRVKLSIAEGLEDKHKVSIDFKKLLEPRSAEARRTGESIYGNLAKLASVFVTTNYDEWLDDVQLAPPSTPVPKTAASFPPATARRVLYKPADFNAEMLSTPNTVFHLHGSVQDRSSMIFTTTHYLERYSGHRIDGPSVRENAYLTFLEVLFRTKNVLFMGYGLNELEILEYVVQKARHMKPATKGPVREEPRHFLLQGFYSHQAELRRSLSDYYLRECNIRLLPFSIDARGYSQLVDVVQFLGSEMPVGPVHAMRQLLEMEALLS
jgi:hypothetical protein